MHIHLILLLALTLGFSQQICQAEILNVKHKSKSLIVRKKKNKVFDKVKIEVDYDSENPTLEIADDEAILNFSFSNINLNNELSDLFNSSENTTIDLTEISQISLIESEEGLSFDFNPDTVTAKYNAKKNTIKVSYSTEAKEFACEGFDFKCSDTVTLQLKGKMIIKQTEE